MEERAFFRFGAVALMAGTALGVLFNLVHPRSSDAMTSAAAEFELIADSGIWTSTHVMLALAPALAGIGLFAFLRSVSLSSSWSGSRG